MDRRVGGRDGIGTYWFRSYLLGDLEILPFGSSGSFRRGRRLDVVRAPPEKRDGPSTMKPTMEHSSTIMML